MSLSYKIVYVCILKLLIVIIYLLTKNKNRVIIPVSQSNIHAPALSIPINIGKDIIKFKVGEIVYEYDCESKPLGEGVTSNVFKG